MMTSPDLASLPTEDLIRRLQKKDQIIVMLALLVICGAILSVSIVVAFVAIPTSAQIQRAK